MVRIVDPVSLDYWMVYLVDVENQRLVDMWEARPEVVIRWLNTGQPSELRTYTERIRAD